jgi:GT2 family glycosyltransferase
VAAVVVTYDEDPVVVRGAIDSLRSQTRPPDEIVLVDNKPGATLPDVSDAPEVRVIAPDVNLGYPNAINFAMEHTNADFVLCMNPDAHAEPECLERLLQVVAEPDVALAGAQVLFPDGDRVNAGGNALHPTGISPAGPYGAPRQHGDAREAIVVSGACCLIRRADFLELGGFMREFFLYYDDADLAWRAWIAGRRVVYCPEAAIRHGYEFDRRGRKMFYLERNRLISVLSNYEARTLLALAPLLLAAEVGILAWAVSQGWLREKLHAYRSVVSLGPALRAHRRAVQELRRRPDRDVLPLFETHIVSPFVPRLPAAAFGVVTAAYLRLVRALL